MLTGRQIRDAHFRAGLEFGDLATRVGVSVDTIKWLERITGPVSANTMTVDDIRRALETAGVEAIPEKGGGAGVRLRKPAL